jgi:hypothetical protein
MIADMELDHAAAMDLIHGAATVSSLSYEEAIAVYLRARGILKDTSTTLAAPIPQGWMPPLAATPAIPPQPRNPPPSPNIPEPLVQVIRTPDLPVSPMSWWRNRE